MLAIVTPVATEPLALAEVKRYIRQGGDEETEFTADDDLLEMLITAAREKAEASLRMFLAAATYDYTINATDAVIRLGYANIATVHGVTVHSDGGDTVAVGSGATGAPKTDILTPDGTLVYILSAVPIADSERVFLGGIRRSSPAEYTISGNQITFNAAFAADLAEGSGVSVVVDYEAATVVEAEGSLDTVVEYTARLKKDPAEIEITNASVDYYAVTVRFTSAAPTVPKMVKLAMLYLVAHYYENRELIITSGAVPQTTPESYQRIVHIYKRHRL